MVLRSLSDCCCCFLVLLVGLRHCSIAALVLVIVSVSVSVSVIGIGIFIVAAADIALTVPVLSAHDSTSVVIPNIAVVSVAAVVLRRRRLRTWPRGGG